MSACDEYAVKTLQYLDNVLTGQELEAFLSHLEGCTCCRERLQAERELSIALYRTRPLYLAPSALRDRVAVAIGQASPSATGLRPQWHLLRSLSNVPRRFSGLRTLALAAIAVALCLAFVPSMVRQARAANYVEAAIAQHRSYLNGGIALGLQSSSPEAVTAWFWHKVPFDFRLPAAGASPEGKSAYRLAGAALVSYQGNRAALVTYETRNERISLLAASSISAVVAGGDEVRSGNLIFHYYNKSGFRVITWSNHGLSYALVSSVSGPAQASCLVCHQSMADRSSFRAEQ
jgi:hypothetical protein